MHSQRLNPFGVQASSTNSGKFVFEGVEGAVDVALQSCKVKGVGGGIRGFGNVGGGGACAFLLAALFEERIGAGEITFSGGLAFLE